MKKYPHVAHGRNMNPEELGKRLQRQINPDERTPVIIPGYQQVFNKEARIYKGFAAGNIIPIQNNKIETIPAEGALWYLTEEELLRLDSFEGVPDNYVRKAILVKLPDGSEIVADYYAALHAKYITKDDPRYNMPHPEYILTILKSTENFLSPQFITYQKNLALSKNYAEFIQKYGDTTTLQYYQTLYKYLTLR